MNTNDIELPPLPEDKIIGADNFIIGTLEVMELDDVQDYARAAIEAYRKQQFENGDALQRYKECGGDEESDPVERLRFYCSLAMSGQDWLDVEPFFDALLADRKTFPQSQDAEDAERIDFLEAEGGGDFLQLKSGEWIVDTSSRFGMAGDLRSAIDHARRAEEGKHE